MAIDVPRLAATPERAASHRRSLIGRVVKSVGGRRAEAVSDGSLGEARRSLRAARSGQVRTALAVGAHRDVPIPSRPLAAARDLRIDESLEYTLVARGHRVLDLGYAHGSLACAAAQRGAHVTALVRDAAEAEIVRFRVAVMGLDHLVEVVIGGLADIHGSYDVVVGMEALSGLAQNEVADLLTDVMDRLAPAGGGYLDGLVASDFVGAGFTTVRGLRKALAAEQSATATSVELGSTAYLTEVEAAASDAAESPAGLLAEIADAVALGSLAHARLVLTRRPDLRHSAPDLHEAVLWP